MSASEEVYDCIVVGLGGHGSSAIAHMAKDGMKVLGIEQFERVHANGSSHGRSRIYRQAYFEDPKYVPLLQRSLKLWHELHDFYNEELDGADSPYGKNVLTMSGGIMIGKPDSVVVSGTLKSINEHNLPNEVLSATETRERFPMMHLADDEIGVYETNAGYLNPEACIEAYLLMAAKHGAELHHNEAMISYAVDSSSSSSSKNSFQSDCGASCDTSSCDSPDYIHNTTGSSANDNTASDVITVVTTKGTYKTHKLVLTVGAWAPEIYGNALPFELFLERRVLFWFKPTFVEGENYQALPVYIWDIGGEEGNFYGFPEQPEYQGQVKVAFHMMDDVRLRVDSPEVLNRTVEPVEVEEIKAILGSRIPSLCGEVLETVTCMYTKTPDEHFLIDFHPKHKNVILASPCSGHGFKFCSVIGEILSDLARDGDTKHDISLFRINARDGDKNNGDDDCEVGNVIRGCSSGHKRVTVKSRL